VKCSLALSPQRTHLRPHVSRPNDPPRPDQSYLPPPPCMCFLTDSCRSLDVFRFLAVFFPLKEVLAMATWFSDFVSLRKWIRCTPCCGFLSDDRCPLRRLRFLPLGRHGHPGLRNVFRCWRNLHTRLLCSLFSPPLSGRMRSIYLPPLKLFLLWLCSGCLFFPSSPQTSVMQPRHDPRAL